MKMLSIIIVSFKTKDLLRGCLSSIFEANLMVDFEIIVVDNDSRDGSVEMCKIEFPDVILLENKTNNMFSKANNQGMAVAKGDALLLLNSDTVVKAGVLETLYAFISDNTQVAAVGPRLINADGSLQSQGYPLSPLFWTIVRNFSLDRILPTFVRNLLFPWTNLAQSTSMRTGWISGACMLISRRAVDKFGGLCEDLYFYGEEVEWCWRAKKNNFQVWCLPFIEILHYGGGSTKKGIAPKDLFLTKKRMENTLTLVKKTTGIPFNLLLSLIIIISGLIKLPVALIEKAKFQLALKNINNEIDFVKLQIKNF